MISQTTRLGVRHVYRLGSAAPGFSCNLGQAWPVLSGLDCSADHTVTWDESTGRILLLAAGCLLWDGRIKSMCVTRTSGHKDIGLSVPL